MLDMPEDAVEDVNRWFIGHQLFFVQIQIMIRLLYKYEQNPSEDILVSWDYSRSSPVLQ